MSYHRHSHPLPQSILSRPSIRNIRLPFIHPFRSPCFPLISLASFIHHAPSFLSAHFFPKSASFSTPNLSLSLPSLLLSSGPGCGVLHPGSVFRVITRLVNSFMDSTLSVTHAGRMPARCQCIQFTYTPSCICTADNKQVNTNSTHMLTISLGQEGEGLSV